MPIDPVCKMEVSIADAAASHDFHGETLYFCSIECLHKFERDPAVYMDDMSDERTDCVKQQFNPFTAKGAKDAK